MTDMQKMIELLNKSATNYEIVENANGSNYTEIRLEKGDVFGFYEGRLEY